MTWEREYFRLAAWVLHCKCDMLNGRPDKQGAAMGEMDYSAEMKRVLQEARASRALLTSRVSPLSLSSR